VAVEDQQIAEALERWRQKVEQVTTVRRRTVPSGDQEPIEVTPKYGMQEVNTMSEEE